MSNIDPTEFCWYRSETQLGLMHVGVETTEAERNNLQGPHCVFQQAALLSNTEVMIQAIELWQEIDLDLVPCVGPENISLHLSLQLNDNSGSNASSVGTDASPSAELAVDAAQTESVDTAVVETVEPNAQAAGSASQTQSNANAGSAQLRIVMVFDCATLVQLKSLSQELQSVLSVTSSNVELRVQLDQISISSEEMEMIEDGAVVVIPAAYQPEWGIVAVSETPEVPLRFGGSIKKSDHALQVQIAHHEPSSSDSPAGGDETMGDSVTVWCKQLCSIPVTELLGIDTNNQTTPPHALDARELSLVQGESTLAYGSLLAYGRGSVVAVSKRLTG